MAQYAVETYSNGVETKVEMFSAVSEVEIILDCKSRTIDDSQVLKVYKVIENTPGNPDIRIHLANVTNKGIEMVASRSQIRA
jgi:hypothetical protein